MSGRREPRTRFARVPCDDPGVAVFKISGSLGPRAKPLLVRLTQECLRRNLPRVVLDLSEVEALGGGTSRLLNAFAAERGGRGGKTAFRVTSRTVRGFLQADPHHLPPPLFESLEEAVASLRGRSEAATAVPAPSRHRAETVRPGASPRRPEAAVPPYGASPRNGDEDDDDDIPMPSLLVGEEEDFDFDIQLGEPISLEPHHDATAVRDELVEALRRRGVASRVFTFRLQPSGKYCMTTRQGLDRECTLERDGGLARSIDGGATFLVDIDYELLSDREAQLLTELNCEVASRLHATGGDEYLAFVSKEQPGDEFTFDEVQVLEEVLRGAGAVAAPRAPADAEIFGGGFVARPSVPAAPKAVPAHPAADATRTLRRDLAQLRDILSLSQDFDAAFGTSRLLEVLVLSVVSVARVETVLYFAARDSEYRLTHHRGAPPESLQGLRLRGEASLVQVALAAPRGVCIGDAAQITEEERIWARQHGLRHAVPFRYKDEVIGLLLLGESAEDASPDLETLSLLLAQAGLAYDRARLYETLQDRTLGVVRGLITLIEARNGFDCGSTERVVRYTQALARELQFPADSVRDLVYGAVLRDVGMLKVSESMLRSALELSADQWESIRRHPQEGASIMRQMRFDPVAIDVVLHHHESYNGEGYPMGLRGRAIPLGARIVAVAESYVKMTMDRPYRKALGRAEALESLAENWGLRYDPLVVDALVRVVNRELSMGLRGDRDFTRDLFELS